MGYVPDSGLRAFCAAALNPQKIVNRDNEPMPRHLKITRASDRKVMAARIVLVDETGDPLNADELADKIWSRAQGPLTRGEALRVELMQDGKNNPTDYHPLEPSVLAPRKSAPTALELLSITTGGKESQLIIADPLASAMAVNAQLALGAAEPLAEQLRLSGELAVQLWREKEALLLELGELRSELRWMKRTEPYDDDPAPVDPAWDMLKTAAASLGQPANELIAMASAIIRHRVGAGDVPPAAGPRPAQQSTAEPAKEAAAEPEAEPTPEEPKPDIEDLPDETYGENVDQYIGAAIYLLMERPHLIAPRVPRLLPLLQAGNVNVSALCPECAKRGASTEE